MPPLPAIFGLDPAGVVAKVGEQVHSIRPGDRVYVNPARKCGSCRMCRSGQPLDCPNFTFQGYFGRSQEIMKAYPYGGLCQYITAPEDALVKLPDNVSFEGAARFGYLGTAYAAMKKLSVGPGQTFLVNGISGMLGLNAAMIALAMGATKILGTGRNAALLNRVKALAPQRIEVFSPIDDKRRQRMAVDPLVAWAKSMTDGYGVDSVLDCLPPGASAAAMMRALYTLRRGGRAAAVGVVMENLPINALLADDQPDRPARLGLVHHRRRRGYGGDGGGRHAGPVAARAPHLSVDTGQRGAHRHGQPQRRLHQFHRRSDPR